MVNTIAIIDESEEECLIAAPISGVFKKGEKKVLLKNLENILADRDGLPQWGICDVFSPPRSSKGAANFGLRDDGAFDIKTGWNFHLLADRRRLWKHLEDVNPLRDGDFSAVSVPDGTSERDTDAQALGPRGPPAELRGQ